MPMGDYKKNNLGREKSPYLQQHKNNPVWWQAWKMWVNHRYYKRFRQAHEDARADPNPRRGIERTLALGGPIRAKPSNDELTSVPHHLIDVLDANERMGLHQFIESATGVIEEISQRGKLPVLVGGTGQYLWGLLEGWEVPAVPPDGGSPPGHTRGPRPG